LQADCAESAPLMQLEQGITQQITTTCPESSSLKRLCGMPAQSLHAKFVAVWPEPNVKQPRAINKSKYFFIIGDFSGVVQRHLPETKDKKK
jgi:hypothetical protein